MSKLADAMVSAIFTGRMAKGPSKAIDVKHQKHAHTQGTYSSPIVRDTGTHTSCLVSQARLYVGVVEAVEGFTVISHVIL